MIDFKYKDISAIREILQKERFRMWKDDWLPKLKKQNPNDVWNWFVKQKNEFTDYGMINIILEKIDKYEQDIKQQLEGMKK